MIRPTQILLTVYLVHALYTSMISCVFYHFSYVPPTFADMHLDEKQNSADL